VRRKARIIGPGTFHIAQQFVLLKRNSAAYNIVVQTVGATSIQKIQLSILLLAEKR